MSDAYRDAGVDIDAAERLVDRIKPLAAATSRPGVLGGLGGFGGLFSLMGRYQDPVLVSGTDGVGTKLLLAQRHGAHDTIGIDLVAMCVNDIIVTGAEPLFFLDYFATGALDPTLAEAVIRGIAEGCRQAGCALLGGETAEMPGMYAPGHYDLAGFAVGAVERATMVDTSTVRPGDSLVGLASSGLHSNGYSLVRKILDDADPNEQIEGRPLASVLTEPTRIYVDEVLRVHRDFVLRGAAHITGGGLPGNLPRVLPKGLGAVLQRGSWHEPPIFERLRHGGELSEADMLRTFNCGLGMVLVVPPDTVDDVIDAVGGAQVGEVVSSPGVQLR